MEMLASPAVTVRRVQRVRIHFKGYVTAITLAGILCVESILLLLVAEGVRRTRLALIVDVGLVGLVGGHFGQWFTVGLSSVSAGGEMQ